MRGSEFAEFRAFVEVARARSFARAAERLGLTPSAMSQTIRTLEQRSGVRLLHRTTRSVSLTDAGRRLLDRLAPAFEEISAAKRELDERKEQASGTVRILSPRIAYVDHIEPMLPRFQARYPRVLLDLTVDDGISDIAAGGYDVGIRLGEFLQPDAIAARLGGPLRQLAAASPAYIRAHGAPAHPRELEQHNCINWRQSGSQDPYRWEFAKDEEEISIAVSGSLILSDRELAAQAAARGAGIVFWVEHRLAPYVASGRLTPLLEDWSPTFPGFFVYHRKHALIPAAVRAFLHGLRQQALGREEA